MGAEHAGTFEDSFSTDPAGLPEAVAPTLVRLRHGDRFALRIAPVAKRIGDDVVRMIAYNGSIPGPVLQVDQGSEVIVDVTNDGDTEATVHWHGLRLENRYDGVPDQTQAPIRAGGTFSYRLQFPDAGFTGTTRTYGRTTALRWASTARSSWSPATRRAGRRRTAS